MLKRPLLLVLLVFIALNLCGCMFFVAGLADSYKVKADLDVPYGKAVDTVHAAMAELKLSLRKAIIEPDRAVMKARYTDDRNVYIMVFRETENTSRIEIRVGTDEAGKEDARKILETIQLYLSK